jgi:uridine kinase
MTKPIIIGVAGGSGSGKTTFARMLSLNLEKLDIKVQTIKQDNYYHDQSDKFDHDGGSVNFDHPNSIDFKLLEQQLKALKNGNNIKMPFYDFSTHKRITDTILTKPTKVILIDGILLYTSTSLIEAIDHKLFVDCPEDTRYKRRLKRDIEERGRTKEGVKIQFDTQVKPMHDQFVEPSKSLSCEIITTSNFEQKLVDWTKKIKSLL